jgi:putative N6-adenine-specific DNA methylase
MRFIAKTFSGLESVLGKEIADLGGENILQIKRGVAFEGDKALMYRANLACRTAVRIYIPMFEFRAPNEKILYNEIKAFEWERLIKLDRTFMIESVLNTDFYNNSLYVSQKVKDAIVDRFREKTNDRPNIDTVNPHFRIQIHIYKDNVSVSLDTSGKPLFMRGYRQDALDAPINECLAAGLVLLSGWDGDSPFYDPMCGSGTIAIEAALIAANKAPNIDRKHFAFEMFGEFDKDLYASIKEEMKAKIVEGKSHNIFASDIDYKAIDTAKMNFYGTKLRGMNFLKTDFFDLGTRYKKGTMVFNPPYDERLKVDDIVGFYRNIGHHLKNIFPGFDAWIISSNKEALRSIGLKPNEKYPVYNGKLESQFCKYELVEKSYVAPDPREIRPEDVEVEIENDNENESE